MELKLRSKIGKNIKTKLLIVPYGIETNRTEQRTICVWLLIVPYGVETSIWMEFVPNSILLLIVPYELLTPLERDENAVLRSRPIRLPCT